MADDKTEKPTPRRLSKAREQGQVAKSADLNSALVLGSVSLILTMYGAYFFQYLGRLTREFLLHKLQMASHLSQVGFEALFRDTFYHSMIVLLPFICGVMVVGIFANLIQVKPLFTTAPLKPSFQKLNFVNGFKRLFSQKSAVELIKGILKMVIIGACGFAVIYGQRDHLMALTHMGFAQGWLLIFNTTLNICTTIAIMTFVLGIADYFFQKYQLMKKLMMSRQEVKDEMKNAEGSPEIKSRIRGAGRAILKKIMKAVPVADVVITNPTHYAIAIQYDPDVAPAPRVVAKGVDHMAFRIRELAKEHKVPIVENKPLARSLYAMVELDHMIPPELFIAVAEVLAYVYKRNKGRKRPKIGGVDLGGRR